MIDTNFIQEAFLNSLEIYSTFGKNELREQGHNASGDLIESIEGVPTNLDIQSLEANIMALEYHVFVNEGVSASNIPFGGTGGGGTSDYIQALWDWTFLIDRSLNERERWGWVFGTAHKHSVEGMPTRKSYAHSSNGRRTMWVEHGLIENYDAFLNAFKGGQLLEDVVSKMIDQINKDLKN